MLKILIPLVLTLYFLTLIQTSFLVHFPIFGIVLNLSLISVILINIFENQQKNLGLWSAVISGFFLDVFSTRFFGFWMLIFILTAFFLKLIIRKNVRIPFITRI